MIEVLPWRSFEELLELLLENVCPEGCLMGVCCIDGLYVEQHVVDE